MNKRLKRVAPLQLGIVSAAVYALLSLVFVPFILLATLFGATADKGTQVSAVFGGLFMIILLPVFYTIFGFIGGIITAAIYNLVAKFTGGIEFTVEEIAPAFSAAPRA